MNGDDTTQPLRDVLAAHFVMWHVLDGQIGGEWRCACGMRFGFSDTAIDHQADQVRANRPDPHAYTIEVLTNAGSMSEHWALDTDFDIDDSEHEDTNELDAHDYRAEMIESGYLAEHVRVVGLVIR